MTPEDSPLWLQAIPDREPWRRGRDAVCFITFFILLAEAAFLTWSIIQGNLNIFLLAVGVGAVAFLFLFFIWIGRNWPRWILAPFFACGGFACFVWGITEGNGPLLLLGIGGLIFFSYLVLAPSVYAFARHQRERINLLEGLIVAAVFVLLMGSLGCGLYAFHSYVVGLESEAVSFAATTFNKVFVEHDGEFLQSNLKDEEREISPAQFIHRLDRELGEPLSVGELESRFTTLAAARHLQVEGRFQFPVIYDSYGPVWVNIQVSRIGEGWQIDHIGWSFRPGKI